MRFFLLRRKKLPLLLLVIFSACFATYVLFAQNFSHLLAHNANELVASSNRIVKKSVMRKDLKNIFYFIESPGYTVNEKCRDGIELRQRGSESDPQADFAVYLGHAPEKQPRNGAKYTAVFEMESEWHSNGDSWHHADFRMWYNLNESFPEPATYFDARTFLVDLLTPPLVEHAQKGSLK
jgi:hypothetical protein